MLRNLRTKNLEILVKGSKHVDGKIGFVFPKSLEFSHSELKRHIAKTISYDNIDVFSADKCTEETINGYSKIVPVAATFSAMRLVRSNGFYNAIFGKSDSRLLVKGLTRTPGVHVDLAFGESIDCVPGKYQYVIQKAKSCLLTMMDKLRPQNFPDRNNFTKSLPLSAQENGRKLANNSSFPAMLLFERTMNLASKTVLSGIKLHNEEQIVTLPVDSQIVYVVSHRSHLDYLVLPIALHRIGMPIPLITAGENLDYFPIGGLLRRGVAFFIKRKFEIGDPFWKAFESYLDQAMKKNSHLCFFLNGRSRTGRLTEPKAGLLKMVMEAEARVKEGRPTFYVPIQVTYDRQPEIKGLAAMKNGKKKKKESLFVLLKAFRRLSIQNGETIVTVGKPLAKTQLETDSPAKHISFEMNNDCAFSIGSFVAACRVLSEKIPTFDEVKLLLEYCADLKKQLDTNWIIPEIHDILISKYQAILPEAFKIELTEHDKSVLEIIMGQTDQCLFLYKFSKSAVSKSRDLNLNQVETRNFCISYVASQIEELWKTHTETIYLWKHQYTATSLAELSISVHPRFFASNF